jgi:hypothetical protein
MPKAEADTASLYMMEDERDEMEFKCKSRDPNGEGGSERLTSNGKPSVGGDFIR